MPPTTEILQRMTTLNQAGLPFVCVTLIAARGSVPQEVGAKMLVTAEGRYSSTVGGGRVEEAAIQHALKAFTHPSPAACETVEWNLQRDIGMTCGGVVTFLFEWFHRSSWNLVIFGAGHVSQALTRILATLDCQITVFDSRPELLAQLPATPNVIGRRVEPLADAVDEIPDGTYVAIMTQGHRFDMPILERILKTRKFPYLGVIGSASKAAVLRRELREAGVTADLEQAFRCPLGLPLGKDSPEEIAISIAAEFLQVRGT